MDKNLNKPIDAKNTGCCLVNVFLFCLFAGLLISCFTVKPYQKGREALRWSTVASFFLLCTATAVYSEQNRKRIAQLPEQTSHAKLISKKTTGGQLYDLTFELEDHTRKSFHVKREDCDTILENESGILTYKEVLFVNFTVHHEEKNKVEFSAANCPNCGAGIQKDKDKEEIVCLYCGTQIRR